MSVSSSGRQDTSHSFLEVPSISSVLGQVVIPSCYVNAQHIKTQKERMAWHSTSGSTCKYEIWRFFLFTILNNNSYCKTSQSQKIVYEFLSHWITFKNMHCNLPVHAASTNANNGVLLVFSVNHFPFVILVDSSAIQKQL